jgi:hypothetical protein
MAAPEYSAANVESAVLQFYYQGASQEIHQWLTNAQMSQAAWNFSWELLMTEKKPEVQFFGASTIAIKVSKFFAEVPEDQVHKGPFNNYLSTWTRFWGGGQKCLFLSTLRV